MLRNYFKIAWRNLLRNPGYSFINIFGLATGLACFILILLFVQHEWSFDRFNTNADGIFRVIQQRPVSKGQSYWSTTSPALAGALVREFPEIKAATTVEQTFNPLLNVGDKYFKEQGIFADTTFLRLFSFPFLEGDRETALKTPGGIVLTASMARRIFGEEDPMGKTILYQGNQPHTVTGIMADVPAASHLQFQYILPITADPHYVDCSVKEPWMNNGVYTYALLDNPASAPQLEQRLHAYIDENLSRWRPEDRLRFLLQPLNDIHLRSQHLDTLDFEKSGSDKYVYLFLVIGFVILLLACVNYTNLAVARSARRAQEIGMRKVAGAMRGQLMAQFLGESLIMTTLALVLALGLVHLLLPFFSQLMDRSLRMDYFGNPFLLPGLLLLVMLVSLLSGSYPAFLMTALRPAQVLKGKKSVRAGSFSLQRVLIVGQYAVSIILVAGSFIIYRQMQLVQRQNLGYNREHVLAIRVNDEALSSHYSTLRKELLNHPGILAMSYSQYLPTDFHTNQSMTNWPGSNGERLSTRTTTIDYDFPDVYGLSIVAGRGFSRDFGADTLGAPLAVINETAAKAVGWTPEEAIGKPFDYSDGHGRRTVIGVVRDFHFNSIHHISGPLVLTLDPTPSGYISARIRPEDLQGTLALFGQAVKRYTRYPFEYQFLDDKFDQLYKKDTRLGKMFGGFTILAILIASLGLFGLAAYTTEQRRKEIGVRKVLGATVVNIVGLLSKDYIKLVLFGFIIAMPVAWYIMDRWLEDFVYRIQIQWWMLALAGLLALIIALLTVSYQSVRAALMNPVKSLKTE
ncbi:putative ABC transport system permease protein [Chitinophaga eiseniae]|uniref:Putative ABC transport system permease protein n=1 Tax=Chitinophaga eiseniae TaxID=634771 RepID=A0A1T4TUN1_9BACT|nr:ABC transporter permease [Chitinophaga eiseniae]SKA44150.1 putative ABC transport system permease protein [Chitinophaga eiseniae]